jgi:hypothetical protein
MFDCETYSLRVVTKFLNERKIAYEHSSARVGFGSFNEHGCRIKLNDTYKLSIQTHPDIAGEAFAETALQNIKNHKICYDGTYSYIDVRRFDNPQQLFDHVIWIMEKAQRKSED